MKIKSQTADPTDQERPQQGAGLQDLQTFNDGRVPPLAVVLDLHIAGRIALGVRRLIITGERDVPANHQLSFSGRKGRLVLHGSIKSSF